MTLENVKWVIEDPDEENIFWPSEEMKRRAWVSDPGIYEEAAEDKVAFWEKLAAEGLEWFKRWDRDKPYQWDAPYVKWFVNGKINASYNAVDRHVQAGKGDKIAVICVPEPPDEPVRTLTYSDLYIEVNKFANVLKKLRVKKGDRVGIYLPMIPELFPAILACARLGAPHIIVFSAFAPDALKVRLKDAGVKVLITADGNYRRGKGVDLKLNVDGIVEATEVEKVVVVKRLGNEITMAKGRDFWWHELMAEIGDDDRYHDCPPEPMDSEDMLFLLYTSGTTGIPKSVIHTTGGYLTQAYWTTKWVFDLHGDDIYWCTADIGWITGHTYACYGPLLNGATQLVYEGAPDYPEPDRWWEIVEQNKVTILYTAPTAIRMFIRVGEEWPKKHDLSSLRLLGSVGEPVDRKTWLWYFNTIGGGRCPIIDTWWQTETGGTLIMSLPGIGPFIPAVSGRPFPGTEMEIVDEEGNPTETGYLVHLPPIAPGMLRGLCKADARYVKTYWSQYHNQYYFTADRALRAPFGGIRITGRVDEVMKVAGHRLSAAEIEEVINTHKLVAESAVVPKPHELKGEVPVAYVILQDGVSASQDQEQELEDELKALVREKIGPTAIPEWIIFVPDLPKTRSGKIMRRVLKSLLSNAPIGDTSTLLNPEVVEDLKDRVGYT